MSRAFTPPDTMSKEDVLAVADVRREIWTNGFKGLFYGSIGGYTMHYVLKQIDQRKLLIKKFSSIAIPQMHLSRNTAFLSFMLGGAIGSFGCATAAGKNNVHNMHSVFERGKKDVVVGSVYQQKLAEAMKGAERAQERAERRVMRRKTVNSILTSRTNLSDSHNGEWMEEKEIIKEMEARRQAGRA